MQDAAAAFNLPTAATVSIPTTVIHSSNCCSGSSGNDTSPVTTPILSIEAVQIVLDDDEQLLFQTLLQTAIAYEQGTIRLPPAATTTLTTSTGDGNAKPTTTTSTTTPLPQGSIEIRVAGGWVRDKLLGLQTHDVDVAVDSLTGVQFATAVQLFCKQHSQRVGKMGVIAANPAQSKHLETATMVMNNVDVDFCNLRADEVYQEDSRIPMCTFGTPAQDAARRDFTCNALFYNIRTRAVEDWTGRGLQDLIAGQLVTPLEPVRTFRDDPLRVLRAIRFAVRYNFALDPALEAAAVLPEIHQALHLKVSRERVGKELEAMLSGKGANPVAALNTIARLKLAGGVFCVPNLDSRDVNNYKVSRVKGHILGAPYEGTHQANTAARERGWEESSVLLNILPTVVQAHSRARSDKSVTFAEHRLLPVVTFLLPFRTLLYDEANKLDKEFSVVAWIFREGIKFNNKDVAAVTTFMETVDIMANFLRLAAMEAAHTGELEICRLDAGLLLRSTKELWVSTLLLATVLKVRQRQQGQDGVSTAEHQVDWIELSNAVYLAILDLDLDESWKMRPLLDGKAVIQALDLPRGPTVGTYLDEQMRWMLLHPAGSREECQRHLLSVKRHFDEQETQDCLGKSDGTGKQPSSPVHNDVQDGAQHFSKKVHVESMEM